MTYKLKLDIFEGPLDLLLYLIKKNDLDISKISISEVTEQYMQYIEMMKMLDLNIIGDFLVMAATLMQIKSRMLLPPDPAEVETEEEAPEDVLVQRLSEYKRFKEIAESLKEKEIERQKFYSRMPDQENIKKIKEESKEYYFEANLFDLINALTEALNKDQGEITHNVVLEEFTVEQKVHDILHLLIDEDSVILQDLFQKCKRKDEIIVTFLAVLELIRLKEIKIFQKRIFGAIQIMRNKDNMVPTDKNE
jgi:segregation and condensation protein A